MRDLEIIAVEPLRAATLTRWAGGLGLDHIPQVVGPVFPEVHAALAAAGHDHGPAVAQYTTGDDGVEVVAGFLVGAEEPAVDGIDVTELDGFDRAAVTLHLGDMRGIGDAWMAFLVRIRADGLTPTRTMREVYLTEGDAPKSEWRTQLVQPVGAAL